MYLVTMLGNLLIILTITLESHLHIPMYSFLYNLPLADFGFSTNTVPKMLVNIQTHSNYITYCGCLTQVFLSSLFGCLGSLLFSVMACECLVATDHHLHYQLITNPCLCGLLIVVSLFISLLNGQVHCFMVSQLSFCSVVKIPHFFCEASQLFNLACINTSTNSILIYAFGVICGGAPVSRIIFSYTRIISCIMKIS
jgi:olfactory receptor